MSSWGYKGFSEVWLNGATDWLYPHLHHAAAAMEKLARSRPEAGGLPLRALNQAARELLLAQSSDWPFMIHGGAMASYGTARAKEHLLRFLRLSRDIEGQTVDETWLSGLEARDNLFPWIDYRLFS